MLDWLKRALRPWVNGQVPVSASTATEPIDDVTTKSHAGQGSRIDALRPVLAGGAPGLWASNHLEESQHLTGWQFIAIRTISKACASASMTVYRPVESPTVRRKRLRRQRRERREKRLRGEKTERRKNNTESSKSRKRPLPDHHPLVRLLARPNPEQSGATFRFQAAQQICLTGTALVLVIRDGIKVRDPLGVPKEMYIIPTGMAMPQLPSNDFPHGSYRVRPLASWGSATDEDGFSPGGSIGSMLMTGCEVDSRYVKAIRWPHPLYLSDGLSPLEAGSVMVDCAESLDRARWHDFRNASRPGVIIGWENEEAYSQVQPEDVAAFRADLAARNKGVENISNDLFLPPGLKAEQTSRTPDEMGYIEGYSQYRDASLALHSVAPVAAGISEAGNYSAFYASLKQTDALAVQPVLDLIAEELTEALTQAFGDGYTIKLDAKAIDDPAVLEQRLTNDLAAKSITINEWRHARGMEPVEWGDVQVGTDVALGKPKDAQPPPGQPPVPGQPPNAPPSKPVASDSDDTKPNVPDEQSTGIRNPAQNAPPGRPQQSQTTGAAQNKE